MKSRTIVINISLLFVLFAVTACLRKPDVIIISERQCQLGPKPLEFELQNSIFRNRENAEIHLDLSLEWSFQNGKLRFENNRIAEIRIVLVDKEGRSYSTNYYGVSHGIAGNTFNAIFSDLNKNVEIVKVVITSSVELNCDRIYWQCYDPM